MKTKDWIWQMQQNDGEAQFHAHTTKGAAVAKTAVPATVEKHPIANVLDTQFMPEDEMTAYWQRTFASLEELS